MLNSAKTHNFGKCPYVYSIWTNYDGSALPQKNKKIKIKTGSVVVEIASTKIQGLKSALGRREVNSPGKVWGWRTSGWLARDWEIPLRQRLRTRAIRATSSDRQNKGNDVACECACGLRVLCCPGSWNRVEWHERCLLVWSRWAAEVCSIQTFSHCHPGLPSCLKQTQTHAYGLLNQYQILLECLNIWHTPCSFLIFLGGRIDQDTCF